MDDDTLARARAYIDTEHWTFAKSVPDQPHWYVMVHQTGDRDEYEWFGRLIAEEGDLRPWNIPGTMPSAPTITGWVNPSSSMDLHSSWDRSRRLPPMVRQGRVRSGTVGCGLVRRGAARSGLVGSGEVRHGGG